MNRFLLLVLIVSGLTLPMTSNAAVFERDWQAPGDGLLTYDDVNQREWLDLTETLLTNFAGNDIESRYQSVVAELAPGGLFEGFIIPSAGAELVAFAESAGIDTTTLTPVSHNQLATLNLISLVGETAPPGVFSGNRTIGLIEDFFPSSIDSMNRITASLFYIPGSGNDGSSGLRITSVMFVDNLFRLSPGVFLYRAVPEPSTILSALIGSILLSPNKKGVK